MEASGSEQLAPEEPPASHRLPLEILHTLTAAASGRQCRLLCRDLRSADDNLLVSLTFIASSQAPAEGLRARVVQCSALRSLSLSQVAVDDACLAALLQELQQRSDARPLVDVSGCRGLTPRSYDTLLSYGRWRAPVTVAARHERIVSTWWLYVPHPTLDPGASIAVQLQALRSLGASPRIDVPNEAFRHCFAYCSHAWPPEGYPRFVAMITRVFAPMLTAAGARLRPLVEEDASSADGSTTRCLFHVELLFPARDLEDSTCYIWQLSSVGGVWMTDGVRPQLPSDGSLIAQGLRYDAHSNWSFA